MEVGTHSQPRMAMHTALRRLFGLRIPQFPLDLDRRGALALTDLTGMKREG